MTPKVKIGCHYVPPLKNLNTPETDFWQPILLKEKRQASDVWRWALLIVACFAFGYWGLR